MLRLMRQLFPKFVQLAIAFLVFIFLLIPKNMEANTKAYGMAQDLPDGKLPKFGIFTVNDFRCSVSMSYWANGNVSAVLAYLRFTEKVTIRKTEFLDTVQCLLDVSKNPSKCFCAGLDPTFSLAMLAGVLFLVCFVEIICIWVLVWRHEKHGQDCRCCQFVNKNLCFLFQFFFWVYSFNDLFGLIRRWPYVYECPKEVFNYYHIPTPYILAFVFDLVYGILLVVIYAGTDIRASTKYSKETSFKSHQPKVVKVVAVESSNSVSQKSVSVLNKDESSRVTLNDDTSSSMKLKDDPSRAVKSKGEISQTVLANIKQAESASMY